MARRKQPLKHKQKKLEIEHAITFIPWLEREQLDHLYRKANVFLFPSHEGAGMVVSEAFSYGLPVLCFNNCGPGEFVDEDCGFSISYQNYTNSITQFSECLMQLYFDRILLDELSQNALLKHSNSFDWDVKGPIFKSVYDSILTQKPNKEIPIESIYEEV